MINRMKSLATRTAAFRDLATLTVLLVAVTPAAVAQSIQSRGISQAQAAASAQKSAGTTAAPAKAAPAKAPPASVKGSPAAPQAGAAATTAPARPGAVAQDKAGVRRDPFISTIKVATPGDPTQQLVCPPGVRGIIVNQLDLSGVARAASGAIAVVTTSIGGRTYFLREGATLCNGRVVKITEDSLILEENVIDPLGKAMKREVIKKIPADAK